MTPTPGQELQPTRTYNELMAKTPDLVGYHETNRLVRYIRTFGEEGERDGRPTIIDYDSGSSGKVRRVMKFADDALGGTGERKCCLRFEVEVKKPGRKAHHQIGDIVIWSQTLQDVLQNPVLDEFLLGCGVNSKKLREALIRDGFTKEAKSF